MIKEKEVLINITNRNITYYSKKKYDIKNGEQCYINVKDLPNSSHVKITAICDICKIDKVITYAKYIENFNRLNYYGCKKCSNIKREKTSNEKWGVSNYRKTNECNDKIKKTNLKKYNVEHVFSNAEIQEKIKKTNLKKYNVEYHLSSKIIRDKIKKTTLKNWGVEHFSKTEQYYKLTYNNWKNKILNKLNKYDINDFKLKKDRTIDIKCDNGNEHYFNINSKNLYQRREIQKTILCTKCNKIDDRISGQELLLKEFILKNTNNKVLFNDRTTMNKELDVYIPDLKIAFEFNGIYWHSDIYKDKNYHLNKTEKCNEKNINLFNIWEDDWLNKQEIIKSMILNKMGKTPNKIYGRKCEIRKIFDNKLIRKFLNENHLQGFIGSYIKIGLFYNNVLISLMVFGKNKRNGYKNIKNHYELLRFCNKLNTTVIGGASKLFKYFIKEYNPKEIITYSDRSYSDNRLYKILGFKFINKTNPDYYYYDSKMNKYNKFKFRKNDLISMGYSRNKSSHEIMDELGYYRVYNSGNIKYNIKIG